MTVFGIIFQFELFMNNDFGVLFFTFFFFSLAMNGLSFFLRCAICLLYWYTSTNTY